MKRFYAHYNKWEDNKAWLYNLWHSEEQIQNSYSLLTDLEKFYEIWQKVINEWIISTKIQFSCSSRNKCAWLWQASCAYLHWSNEDNTKQAWSRMTDIQREEANKIANNLISNWKYNG